MASAHDKAYPEDKMNLRRLEEVSDGNYVFYRPLILITCALSVKYVCYLACRVCNRKVAVEVKGHHSVSTCPIHGRQKGVPLDRYAMGILLSNREGPDLWVTAFDRIVQRALGGFSASDYVIENG